MKKIMLALAILAILLGAGLFALEYRVPEVYDGERRKFVCIMNEGVYYWSAVKNGVEQASEDLNIYTKYYEFNRFDVEEQIRLLNKATYADVDGIITIGEPYSLELNETLQRLRESGIPVVLVDTDAKESGRVCYVGTDNYSAGQIAARKIIEETGGETKIAVFTSQMGYANQEERLSGFRDAIESYAHAEIAVVFEGSDDKAAIQKNFNCLLENYADINAIFFAEGASSVQLGTIMLENPQDYEKIVIIGFDDADVTLKCVEEGLYAGTIVQSGYDMGYRAVECLNAYLSEGQAESIYTDAFLLIQPEIDVYAGQ